MFLVIIDFKRINGLYAEPGVGNKKPASLAGLTGSNSFDSQFKLID